MRYLVTGGAGFIGSNTVDELVRRGHSVVVLDDLSGGKEENLAEIRNKITFIFPVLVVYDNDQFAFLYIFYSALYTG